jgi:hypothetical protein
VTVTGQTITVSGVTLADGGTFTITYGSRASSGPGATAPSTAGAQTWQVQQKAKNNGILTNLASSPSIGVVNWDSYNTTGAACGNTQSNSFAGANQTVCGRGAGYTPGATHSVAFYDGGGTQRAAQNSLPADGAGVLSSTSFSLYNNQYVAGTWHVVVFSSASVPGTTYASISGNASLVADDTFTVDGTAVPGLPTPVSAVLASLGGGGVYYFLRRRALPVRA